MWSTTRLIAPFDTIIIYLTRDTLHPLVVTPGKDYNTKFGNFKQADFVGVPYGSKVAARTGVDGSGGAKSRLRGPKSGKRKDKDGSKETENDNSGKEKEKAKGWIHLLRPTPELWTLALPHRTQILYLADISFITSKLGVKPGSGVVEAGTGSASFSHSVARTIGKTGRLWSYEFHEARYHKAKEEFTRHGLSDTVTIQHRNVCKDGFTIVDEADAVFLDLPAPWDAVEHAKKALRKDRPARICCFSPCIEQVLRTVSALNDAGFAEITTYETLLRPIEVFQSPPLPSVRTAAEKLKASERRREDKRVRQVRDNAANAAKAERAKKDRADKEGKEIGVGQVEGDVKGKRKREVIDDDDEAEDGVDDDGLPAVVDKRLRTDDDQQEQEDEDVNKDQLDNMDVDDVNVDVDIAEFESSQTIPLSSAEAAASSAMPLASTSAPLRFPPPPAASMQPQPPTKINISKALPEVRGHTSYLTFACLIPVPLSFRTAAEESKAKEEVKEEVKGEEVVVVVGEEAAGGSTSAVAGPSTVVMAEQEEESTATAADMAESSA